MRKDISPELYNYNKFPGPEFKQIDSKIVAEKFEFELIENYKEGFDLTAFHQRFSEILTKFDYIVGDWGNEQLRLRGFYKDERANESDEKISRLEDYLLEYCSYGCAYLSWKIQILSALPLIRNRMARKRQKVGQNVLATAVQAATAIAEARETEIVALKETISAPATIPSKTGRKSRKTAIAIL